MIPRALDFAVEKSLRYHQRRRAHYDRLHKTVMLGVLLAGSSAIAQFHATIAGLFVVALSALDLTFGFSAKARDHEFLYRRFNELAQKLRSELEPSDAHRIEWDNERLRIEADEPPIYWALEADCYNEVLYSRGMNRADVLIIGRYRRLFMNYRAFDKEMFPQAHELGNDRAAPLEA